MMKTGAPAPIGETDLQRLENYGSAVRQMRAGQFDKVSAPNNVADPIDAFGHELAQLGQWLEVRFSEFRKLQELSEEIGSELFAENVLDRIYKTFRSLIPYDRIGCALLEDDGQFLCAYWARADYLDTRLNKNYTAKMAGSSLEQIIATGKPRIINDLEEYLAQNPGSKATRTIIAEGIRSSLTCPLIANGKPIGFLFFSSREKNTYDNVHHDIFLQIAGQVSVLIEKSLLYQQLFDLNTLLSEAHQQLKEQSMHDALTGVLNRGAIFELLEHDLSKAKRNNKPVTVIMADIDHFKSVNDNHGHIAGDAVLNLVATRIKNALRGYDHVGRYGGEEFMVVLSDTDLTATADIAERVRQSVEVLEVQHEDHTIQVTLSQGIAMSNGNETIDDLVARADKALYRAKQDGRNRYCMETSSLY
ncbi:sensor domain-containing diguanylate cyclase [Labrenzia sp. PHM005]|uniref:sensor domain-containing diguanylate cyclase n=1 Tax=Labrenzia sp. PHM005 TaxID=2590016 RepID=UPI001AD8C916|nr:sensor domain-containing diguanylate cyclase [Labrenzia sp. PHM005]